MPSFARTRRKKKPDEKTDVTNMASSGRYRKVDQDIPTGTFVRNVTTQRKSEQAKNTRSQSVPSLNSTDVVKQPSPSRQPRSNSVRMSSSIRMFSIRRRIAKMFGSHSDLSGKGITSDHQSSGVYRPIVGCRPQSIGGSSDCSTSSLTSAPQQSDFSRHNSLRESSHSRVSQSSVFSSRQPSCDSADALNFSVHGSMVPTESGLRPRSIACMQRSGSNSSLKNNSLHDPRYYSLAALSSNRVDPHESFVHSMDERILNTTRGGFQRVPPLLRTTVPPQEEPEIEELSGRVKPSDPGYRKVAENLMSCSPLPTEEVPFSQQSDTTRKTSADTIEDIVGNQSHGIPPSLSSPMMASFRSRLGDRRPLTPDAGTISLSLPPEWEAALTASGLRYYINHQTQTTHWNIFSNSSDPTDDDSDLPSGWELVKSKRYGTYYVNHNNCTAQYQHPLHAGAPPPYHLAILQGEEEERDRKAHIPMRSHSHRSSQGHRVFDPNASLPRRSKSFRDALTENAQLESAEEVLHTRQLSTMTYVPPSPFQIAEIPFWFKEYVDAPFGSEKDKQIQWSRCPQQDLSGLDTMIKRLLKKSSEQLVKKFEYHKVALQKELDQRQKQQTRRTESHRKKEPFLPPPPPSVPILPQGYVPPHHHPPNGVFRGPRPFYPPTGPNYPSTSSYYSSHFCPSSYPQGMGLESHLPSSRSPSPPHITSTTVRSTDVYNGSEETFV